MKTYKPLKCLVLRRCLICGAITEEEHKDYQAVKNMAHPSYEHKCNIMWDTMPSGSVFGAAEFIGYVIDSHTVEV